MQHDEPATQPVSADSEELRLWAEQEKKRLEALYGTQRVTELETEAETR